MVWMWMCGCGSSRRGKKHSGAAARQPSSSRARSPHAVCRQLAPTQPARLTSGSLRTCLQQPHCSGAPSATLCSPADLTHTPCTPHLFPPSLHSPPLHRPPPLSAFCTTPASLTRSVSDVRGALLMLLNHAVATQLLVWPAPALLRLHVVFSGWLQS